MIFYPADELLKAETIASSQELVSQRLYALGKLIEDKPRILVTHPSALLRYLPAPETFKDAIIHLKPGDNITLEEMKAKLTRLGYKRVNKIDQSLQFAIRGDIVDIFSVNETNPIRIEFFDDEVESIRNFKIETQSSFEKRDEVLILPADEIVLTPEQENNLLIEAQNAISQQKSYLLEDKQEILESTVLNDISDILDYNFKPISYKYLSFIEKEPYNVLSYFPHSLTLVVGKTAFYNNCQHLFEEAELYYLELFKQGLLLRGLHQYLDPDEALGSASKVIYSEPFFVSESDEQFTVQDINIMATGMASLKPTLESYLSTENKVVLALFDKHQKEIVINFLKENNLSYEEVSGLALPEGKLGITDLNMTEGFSLPSLKITYLTPKELFGRRKQNSRFSARFKNATILRSYEELNPGDYVVHEYKGIGQFLTITTLNTNGINRDYLKLLYKNNEILYVPLEQFRLVRKYAGREGAAPRLSSLSTNGWTKTKQKIQEKIDDLADRLLALYRDRLHRPGFAFPKDDELQKEFEASFPYLLTDDQENALNDIKKDMEEPYAMDRLLCGDVGFGKTEVAFEAAFKALEAGKQVCLLCPTTLLAKQHYEVALERFNGYGINIGLFTRLVKPSLLKEQLEELKEGKIHFAIGTHKLLGKKVAFKDLGLLIVDEEQRFGVEQKETIKEIKRDVDVLTLSATPIPRTLQMSLVGLRGLSEINTAPQGRMPIQTYVTPYKESVVEELIGREVKRGGQVYYIHNRIDSIYGVAERLERHLPNIKVGVVHGQMEKEDMEQVMESFYDGDINVLVATSIIENGIDVPNANMLIVENADRFGLSQLYQIKGRVGRSDKIAYAYLTYNPNKRMEEDAVKRLKAIQEFAQLGSGYKIAQRDLMIRGAGDILGPEQAGFIDTVGLDLYLKMLREAMDERQGKSEAKPIRRNPMLALNAYIPEDYAIHSDKIEMYQEIENIENEKKLDEYVSHVKDLNGPLPTPFKLLIQKKKIDLLLENEEFGSITDYQTFIVLYLSEKFNSVKSAGIVLAEALGKYLKKIKAGYDGKQLRLQIEKSNDWVDQLEDIIRKIHNTYLEHVNSNL